MAQTIVIWQATGSTMVDSWTTTVLCTRRKDGSFSLRVHSASADGGVSAPAGFTRIRSADQFIANLCELIEVAGCELDKDTMSSICEDLAQLDPSFAKEVSSAVNGSEQWD